MRRFAVAGLGLFSVIGFASAASAADFPLKAPPLARAPAFCWTGCFAGVHAGGDFSYDKIRSSGDFSSAGFVGGGQIGCDYQFASGWVIGAEGRAAWSSLSGNTAGAVTFPAAGTVPTRFTVSNDFLASTTARLGHTFTDRWLFFVRGGAAWTREKADHAFTVPVGGFRWASSRGAASGRSQRDDDADRLDRGRGARLGFRFALVSELRIQLL